MGATVVLVGAGLAGHAYATPATDQNDGLTSASSLGATAAGLSADGASADARSPIPKTYPNPPAPGLPEFYIGRAVQGDIFQSSQSFSSLTAGNTEVSRSKLGVQLPISITAIDYVQGSIATSDGARFASVVYAYLQSPNGLSPGWGLLPPFTTTTLAFGFVPVSTTVHIAQLRTAANLPQPLILRFDSTYAPGGGTVYDSHLLGQLDLSLTDVTIDGKPLTTGSTCHTSTPATLEVVGKSISPAERKPGYYAPPYGGDLYGTLDVPAFTGCIGPSGDDVSAVITNAISGAGNPVHLNLGKPNAPVNPADPALGCVYRFRKNAINCGLPDSLPVPTKAGEVPSTPPNYTPHPSPFKPYTPLPNPSPTSASSAP